MQHVEIPLVDVARQEQVQRLGLTDVRRTVCGQFHDPALVEFESGLEHVTLVIVEFLKMLHRAFVLEDRGPDFRRVEAFPVQQGFKLLVLHRERARQGLVGVDVGRDRLDAGRRAAADDRDRRGWGDRHLVAEAGHHAGVTCVFAGATLLGELDRGGIGALTDRLEDLVVPDLRHGAFHGDVHLLQERVEAHHAEANRALTLGGIDRAVHFGRGALDEVFQHVIEEAEHVFDEGLVFRPFEIFLGIHRGQAAHSRPVDAAMVDAGRKGDFRAEVRLGHLEAQLALVGRHGIVHRVGEQQIGFAGLHAQLEDLLPQLAGVDRLQHLPRLRRDQAELFIIADGFHEGVGDVQAVVQVQGLAVEVARRFADFQEFFDFRVVDVEVTGSRAAAQGALRNRERQRVHHADERDDAGGLPVLADFLTDRADIAPIGADAAAVRSEPDILGPGADDVVERVADLVEEAGDRQATIRATVRENRRRRHEPELRHIVIETLGVGLVVGEGLRHAGKHVLIGLARQQIAVFKRALAEFRQQRIARRIGHNFHGRDHAQLCVRACFRLALARCVLCHSIGVGCRHAQPSRSIENIGTSAPSANMWRPPSFLTLHIVSEG